MVKIWLKRSPAMRSELIDRPTEDDDRQHVEPNQHDRMNDERLPKFAIVETLLRYSGNA